MNKDNLSASDLNRIREGTKIYNTNVLSRIGDHCICPTCNTSFTKSHPQQIFCKPVCRQRYSRLNYIIKG